MKKVFSLFDTADGELTLSKIIDVPNEAKSTISGR